MSQKKLLPTGYSHFTNGKWQVQAKLTCFKLNLLSDRNLEISGYQASMLAPHIPKQGFIHQLKRMNNFFFQMLPFKSSKLSFTNWKNWSGEWLSIEKMDEKVIFWLGDRSTKKKFFQQALQSKRHKLIRKLPANWVNPFYVIIRW